MIEILLWVGAVLWVVISVQFLLNCILTDDLSKIKVATLDDFPRVSIVVPARDEERYIGDAVRSFCTQDYPDYEVIVVDDLSTDRTPEILAELQKEFSHLTVIRGSEPPKGWLGKPNALEAGRRVASGSWLLFVDADIIYGPELLKRSMGYAKTNELSMLSLGANTTTDGVFEAALMSTLYFALAATVPLFLVNKTSSHLFAAGGGVFNLVQRTALEAAGAFESLKGAVIDDIGLGYKVRKEGFKTAIGVAGPMISLRMYHGAGETIDGFSKNLYPSIRSRPYLLVVMLFLGFTISFLPYYGLVSALFDGVVSIPALISLSFMHLVFLGIALFFKQPWYITFLNPLREAGWAYILLRSMVVYYKNGGILWRGRVYKDQP